MKAIITILSVCFILITASIIYLIRSGVSVRSAPIIKPSHISHDFENVAQGIFLRLFPDFQQSEIVLWGLPKWSPEATKMLSKLQARFESDFKTQVHLLQSETPPTPEAVRDCARPCWIILDKAEVHQLAPNPWVTNVISPLNRSYFSVTWVSFQRNTSVPDLCVAEKRLDVECLKKVSVAEVAKKMKDNDQRYFFMRKYLDRDYFLFIEEPLPAYP